jgi:hypothetical protein
MEIFDMVLERGEDFMAQIRTGTQTPPVKGAQE